VKYETPICAKIMVLSHHRILGEKTTTSSPQHKRFGLFWYNLFVDEYRDGDYSTFEEAQWHLCNYLRKPVVEYLDFDCDCGEN